MDEVVNDRFEDIPRDNAGIPLSRKYRHQKCNGVTEIGGDDFSHLSNPYQPCTQTFCCTCSGLANVSEVVWTDSGEVVREYRHRVLMQSPFPIKYWRLGVGVFVGVAIGFGIAYPFFNALPIEESEKYYVGFMIAGGIIVYPLGGYLLDLLYKFDPRRIL